ncbi:isochorismatase family protein [Paraburkholderia strydomiana]
MFTFTHRNPEMQLDRHHTALVLADIQNEFLSEHGSYYPMIEDSLRQNNVPEHIEQLLAAAKEFGFPVIHSPHYYFPTDRQWVAPGGAISDYLATEISFVAVRILWTSRAFTARGPIILSATRNISRTGRLRTPLHTKAPLREQMM